MKILLCIPRCECVDLRLIPYQCVLNLSMVRFGTSEFNLTGSLITWDVTDRLDRISCPTLVCNGHEEGAQDFVVEPFIEKIPKVKWVKFKKTHIPFYEDKEYYFETIGAFLMPT